MVSSDYYKPAWATWEPPVFHDDDGDEEELDAAIAVLSDPNATEDDKEEAWEVVEEQKLDIEFDVFPFFVNLYTENTAPPLDAAMKQEAEALYQQVRDKITPAHCQRLTWQWLSALSDACPEDGDLSSRLRQQLEIDLDNPDLKYPAGELLEIGLHSFSCTFSIPDSDIGFNLMVKQRYNFNRQDAESALAEAMSYFDLEGCTHWKADIVTLGDWCDFPVLHRSHGFFELPGPCILHKNIGRNAIDVISLETLKALVTA
jgi:hypothetical protein